MSLTGMMHDHNYDQVSVREDGLRQASEVSLTGMMYAHDHDPRVTLILLVWYVVYVVWRFVLNLTRFVHIYGRLSFFCGHGFQDNVSMSHGGLIFFFGHGHSCTRNDLLCPE